MPPFLLLACAAPVGGPAPDPWERLGAAPRPRLDPETDLPPAAGPPPLPDEDPEEDPALSAFLYAEGAITDLALRVEPSALATLDADADAEVPAELTHDGERWTVGLRIKGNMSRRGVDGKPSWKLDLRAYRPHQRFYGLRHLTLNNMIQDKSMLKEHLAYALYRALGVPAPRHGYARVTVNGATYGLYGLVESMDQGFVDGWWPEDDEGNLYEGGYGADLRPGRIDGFQVQEDGEPAPPADLEALVAALEAMTPETTLATLEARLDLDAVLDALAVDLVAGNWDGYARAANNFLLYRAPRADRWWLVPWGQDQAFTDRNVPFHAGWEGRLLELCGRDPACTDRLHARVDRVLAAWTALPDLGRSAAAAIAADCEADPRAELACNPEDVLTFLDARPDLVRAELRER